MAGNRLLWMLAALLAASNVLAQNAGVTARDYPNLVFNCTEKNDLYAALAASGVRCPRFDDAVEAIDSAKEGDSVLILADGYPDRTTRIDPALFEKAAARQLRLYIEYPAAIPGLEIESPRATEWERIVVAGDAFGERLPKLRILAAHGCRFTPTSAADPLLVVGRVAGFDSACFGLPEKRFPILFEIPDRRLTIATTCLSCFVSGRYAPVGDWRTLWTQLLTRLDPGGRSCPLARTATMPYVPPVTPKYGPRAPLPKDFERQTLRDSTKWLFDSHLLVHPAEEAAIHKMLLKEVWERPVPPADAPIGDGRCGILEGFASAIQHDGSQRQRTVLRSDCIAESAMCLALDADINRDDRSAKTAANLLDYIFFTSEMQGGVRGDPKHPAFGHVAWGAISPLWTRANYGDDDARVILSTIVAGACLKSDRWDERVMRALLANLRTTGPLGFRGGRIDIPDLERHGWRHFHEAKTIHYSPHYESYLWACNLWVYRHTGYRPFFDKSVNAIRMTMDAYPGGWLWRNNLERARMLLCLAWLIRVDDTSEHRGWLKRVADDLLAYQDASGAIAENLGVIGSAHALAPTTNEEYGTRETPLIQENGDPASDQLYTTGFALFALHEAFAATHEAAFKKAEDKLAEYLCRIQVRSKSLPYLDGGWFRAFDFKRWEYWASSADAGWGAWCLEAGWGHAWTIAALGMRLKDTSMWDLTADSTIREHMDAVQALMTMNDGGPWRPTTRPAGQDK